MKNSPQIKGGELSDKSFGGDYRNRSTHPEKQTQAHYSRDEINRAKHLLLAYFRKLHPDKIIQVMGDTSKMCCPYHDDRNPSAHVHLKYGVPLFHCFACGVKGDIFKCASLDFDLTLPKDFPKVVQAVEKVLGQSISRTTTSLTIEEQEEQNRERELRVSKREEDLETLRKQNEFTLHLRENRLDILRKFYSEFWRDDLIQLDWPYCKHHHLLPYYFVKGMFSPTDGKIWTGGIYDSGDDEKYAQFFKSYGELCQDLKTGRNLPDRISASTYPYGATSRADTSLERKFVIVESDEMEGFKPSTRKEKEQNMAWNYALARFCEHEFNMNLCAIIGTGNKSLNCWFEMPSNEQFQNLLNHAEGLGIDRSVLEQGHLPLRLPLCKHKVTKREAELLFFRPPNHKSFY